MTARTRPRRRAPAPKVSGWPASVISPKRRAIGNSWSDRRRLHRRDRYRGAMLAKGGMAARFRPSGVAGAKAMISRRCRRGRGGRSRTRSIAAKDAVAPVARLRSARCRRAGCVRFFFSSIARPSIRPMPAIFGPVGDALLEGAGARKQAIYLPGLPRRMAARIFLSAICSWATSLLSDLPAWRHHPLNPMTDAIPGGALLAAGPDQAQGRAGSRLKQVQAGLGEPARRARQARR